MAQVTLRINGYAYMIGCKDGEKSTSRRWPPRSTPIDGFELPPDRVARPDAGDGRAADGRRTFELREQLWIAPPRRRPSRPQNPTPSSAASSARMAKRAEEIADGWSVPRLGNRRSCPVRQVTHPRGQ